MLEIRALLREGVSEVRLIGLDTPETVDPGEPVEPLGPRSSVYVKERLLGQRIGLEFDVERTDQYDRLLAYVYLENRMFNEALVRGGYAQAYPTPATRNSSPPPKDRPERPRSASGTSRAASNAS